MSEHITAEELRRVAEEAAEKGAIEALQKLGFDTSNPLEVQRDLQYLNNQRKASERISLMVRVSLIVSATTGLASLLWVGFTQALKV